MYTLIPLIARAVLMFAPWPPIARPMNSVEKSNSMLNGVAIFYFKMNKGSR
jgi:hypothetical protein